MGIITSYLKNMLVKQVDTYGLVVWFDLECHYADVVWKLEIPDTTLVCYEGSFFALRHEIEPLMGGFDPPRLVIYVPMDPSETHSALAEVEAAGVTMKPGQQPPTRNTRLSLIARNALKPILGEEITASIEKQVEEGKLTLFELDELADKGKDIGKGVVSVIFGTGNPQEITLEFLSSERYDTDIINKGAAEEVSMLLSTSLGTEMPDYGTPNDHRVCFARHVLTTDFVTNLRGGIPATLSTVRTATEPTTREACTTLAKTWRLRRDLRESYVAHANHVEKELGLTGINFTNDQIIEVETFLEIERILQRNVETALLEEATEKLVEIARSRQSSFWSEYLPDVQARWALIAVSGQVLIEADRVAEAMKSASGDVMTFFTSYTESERPWCLLDTYHRHMERRCYNFDFDIGERDRNLEQLIGKARNRYMEVGSKLAENFLQRYREARFRMPDILHQTEIFHRKVKPALSEGKTAYVWVDALRFEMSRELVQNLAQEFTAEIQSALATIPTVTEIGMAALLPGTEESSKVVTTGDGKLALEVSGVVIRGPRDRVKFLKANAGVAVFDVRLDDLLPSPKSEVREGIHDSELILVTSQEIDALCEGDNVLIARQAMDNVLRNLRRAFQILTKLDVKTIVFTADHGYLFGGELSSDMKIDAPGGETADLHRRVWIGHGGTADVSYIREQLSDFGLGGELEIAVPWNFACFKVKGGAKAYFHGGLSLQELAIPVATLTPKKKEVLGFPSEVAWILAPGSQKISTRFFSVQVKGSATSLFELAPPRVRIEIREKRDCISTPVSASYGFEEATGDVQLRLEEEDPKSIEPNTVTLMIAKEPTQKTVTIHLLDAVSGTELARLEQIEVAIAI